MAPHIVSWGWNEPKSSPGASSPATLSVVPIESLFSDPYMKSPAIPEASRTRTAEPAARPTSFLGVGLGTAESDGSRRQSEDSFIRHGKYFFKDGNVTFLVDGILYCVHRYFFSRDSVYFSTRFAQLGVRDHEASSTTVSLGDIEREDFEAFLSVLYPENFEERDLSYEQWRSVLHLSTRWGFASLRKLALRLINPPTSYDRLILARTYAVDDWILPALTALCERKAPLSLDEARGMSMEDVVLVASVREDIRSKSIRSGVSAAEISRHVEAMQAGAPIPDADDEVPSASPTRATELPVGPGLPPNATSPGLEVQNNNDIKTMAGDAKKPQGGNTEQADEEQHRQIQNLKIEPTSTSRRSSSHRLVTGPLLAGRSKHPR